MDESAPDEGLGAFGGSDVDDLIWLGHLEEEFEYAGHTFVLRTLRADEELIAATLVKDYMETLGQAKAWAWANIALALVAIDGDENWYQDVSPAKKTNARGKFNWLTQNWYWPLGEYLFYEYTNLVRKQIQAIDEVRNLSDRSQQDFMPSADSLTEQGDSEKPQEPLTNQPILEHLEED